MYGCLLLSVMSDECPSLSNACLSINPRQELYAGSSLVHCVSETFLRVPINNNHRTGSVILISACTLFRRVIFVYSLLHSSHWFLAIICFPGQISPRSRAQKQLNTTTPTSSPSVDSTSYSEVCTRTVDTL